MDRGSSFKQLVLWSAVLEAVVSAMAAMKVAIVLHTSSPKTLIKTHSTVDPIKVH